MKGIRYILFAAVLTTMTLGASTCGTQLPVLDNVQLEITEDFQVRLTQEFDQNVQIDVGGRFMIPDLPNGYIEIIPGGGATGRAAAIAVGVDLSAYGTEFPLRPVNSLPNGMPFPGTWTGPMLAWVVDDAPNNSLVAYVGIETGELAFAAQLEVFDEILFPGSLISFLFRDDETGEVIADVTLYGPAVDGGGGITSSGGVAVHAYIDAEFLPGGEFEGEALTLETANKTEY